MPGGCIQFSSNTELQLVGVLKPAIHQFKEGIYASRNACVKDIDSYASMVLQNYQNYIEITYIVALGVGFKCPRKIHLNTLSFLNRTKSKN